MSDIERAAAAADDLARQMTQALADPNPLNDPFSLASALYVADAELVEWCRAARDVLAALSGDVRDTT